MSWENKKIKVKDNYGISAIKVGDIITVSQNPNKILTVNGKPVASFYQCIEYGFPPFYSEDWEVIEESPTFEIGKWYEFTIYKSQTIAKIKSYTSNYNLSADYWIHDGTYFTNGAWNPNSITEIREIKVEDEDIQKYLPTGHVDKIVSIPEYVECLATTIGFSQYKIYKTIEGSDQTIYRMLDNSGLPNGWRAANFKPSTKEAFDQQNKPKEVSLIGRWIKALVNGIDCSSTEEGKYYKIIDRDSTSFILNVPTSPYISSNIEANRDKYELMPEGWSPNLATNDPGIKPTEDLLSIAKEKYPIGTKYKHIGRTGPSEYIVTSQNFSKYSDEIICAEPSKGWLYYKGKWAEIVPKGDFKVPNLDQELLIPLQDKKLSTEEFFKPEVKSMDFTIFTQQTPKQLGVISIKQIKI